MDRMGITSTNRLHSELHNLIPSPIQLLLHIVFIMVQVRLLCALLLLVCLSCVSRCEAFQAAAYRSNVASHKMVTRASFPFCVLRPTATTKKSSSTVLHSNNGRFDPVAAATTATFAFGVGYLVLSLVLPHFGYDFVVRDGRLAIGTVEEAQALRDSFKQRKLVEKEVLSTSISVISSTNRELLRQQ